MKDSLLIIHAHIGTEEPWTDNPLRVLDWSFIMFSIVLR